jgi:flagellum-specific ATP synthase
MTMQSIDLSLWMQFLDKLDPLVSSGTVRDVTGLIVESDGPAVAIGDFCEIETGAQQFSRCQVTGFRDGRVLLMPLEELHGIRIGARVIARPGASRLAVGPGLLGRVLDGLGNPIDSLPAPSVEDKYDIYATPPGPLDRKPIEETLPIGVRAIDALLTCGKGQRIGIFGGSGVGKSTLLGAMVKHSAADVAVIALIGERNREVQGFLEHELGPEGRKKSVVVVATSDRPAPLRIRAAFSALAIAEYFRDQGKSVLLVMDSVTRLAMAQREIGLAAGEPPGPKGYPPSVFNLLPKICERAGNFPRGSITAFFTVLVEGDDFNEPVCDAVRGIIDGHIILSRQLGAAGHYPAIDILQSVSRLASQLNNSEQKQAAVAVREAMAAFSRAEDLINLGAYAEGANPLLDAAIRTREPLNQFLRQSAENAVPLAETQAQLRELAQLINAR